MLLLLGRTILIGLLITATAGRVLAIDAPSYDDPEEAVSRILAPLVANDRPSFLQSMTEHFDEQGKAIDSLVFDSFLTTGEAFEYVDRLQSEELGATLKRYLYVLRTSAEDFLYIRIGMVKYASGWIVYDLDVKSDLSALMPQWDNP
jgi:hypothetical protein